MLWQAPLPGASTAEPELTDKNHKENAFNQAMKNFIANPEEDDMGGGFYDVDVATNARANTNSNDAFSYEGYNYGADNATARRGVHPDLDPNGKIRECCNEIPIVMALDVTRSRGDDTKVMYEKLPMFIGQLELHGYVPGAAISFAAVGDANSDQAPIQVGQFEADNRLDAVLQNFWIEEGGGGTGQESYELAAYFYARHTKLDAFERGEKGFFFFVGDEGFYPTVSKDHVAAVFGRQETADIDSRQIFAELQERFHVFYVFPKASFEDRKQDIDAEIKQRVEAAGGQYENVDVRASLIWNNTNDLDLHVITPSGQRIFYQNKRSSCGGWLDVDMNVRGETTKPVENVRWEKGKAPKGTYEVRVQNFRFHESNMKPTPYELEVEVHGETQRFKGVISPNGQTQAASEILVHSFHFDPDAAPVAQTEEEANEHYANYDDAVIRAQWAEAIGEENILEIEDPHAIIDVMLGAMAITRGTHDIGTFIGEMGKRNQSAERRRMVEAALLPLSTRQLVPTNLTGSLPTDENAPDKGSNTKRL